MRNAFLILCLLFFISSPAFAMPDYDLNKEPTVYDVSYNIALRNKLEDKANNYCKIYN